MQTNTTHSTVSLFMEDISKTSPMSKEEEKIVVRLAKTGNRMAREKLLKSNMRFVLSVVRTYKSSPLPVSDMVNEGMLGMARALDDFNPDSGMRFISYAVWWIRSYIGKAINDYGYSIVRLPANKYSKLFDCINTGRLDKLSRQEQLMCPMVAQPASLDTPIDGDSDMLLGDILSDANSMEGIAEIEAAERDEIVSELLGMMDERSRKALDSHFFKRSTMEELRSDLKLSRERIRQIKSNAISKLKAARGRKDTATGQLLGELS